MGKYTMIDLFSGAGGMSCGFHQAGFKSVLAVEMDPGAAQTYRANFGSHVLEKPIEAIPSSWFPKADIVIGGPPCQGFSPLGQMSPRESHLEMNKLWQHFLRVVGATKPKAFVIENVPQILRSAEYEGLEYAAKQLGYNIESRLLLASDYGVPQKRRRAFIIGIRRELGEPSFPTALGKAVTVRDAIGDLPLVPTEENWHIGRSPTPKSVERYRCVPPGGNRFDLMQNRPDITPKCWLDKPTGSTDVFGRMEWDKPSLTIRTEFYKPEKGCYLHPEAHRPITHREAARLQTFPDDFVFEGSRIQVARQIGNAVPPKLAEAVARHLANLLDGCGSSTKMSYEIQLQLDLVMEQSALAGLY